MKQIIPFKKELPFKTKVSDITSISLEREINVQDDGIVSGVFHITGDYKMNEGSINREEFSFDLPFDITLDPRYDIKTVNSDIDDFYYDVINEDTLKVNIDLYVEAEYLPEPEVVEEDNTKEEETTEVIEVDNDDRVDIPTDDDICNDVVMPEVIEISSLEVEDNPLDNMVKDEEEEKRDNMDTKVEDKVDNEIDLFSNLDDKETYTTYYVYIVKEDDTIDNIIAKYSITKEDFESYNDISSIKPGDKVIIPKVKSE